jgi:hypothetical protein
VGTLLFVCYFMAVFVGAPQEITVPASVILTSAIFLAGATTVAGAGVFAVFIMFLVTCFLALAERDLLFSKWSYLVIFWFIFPLLNATSDFVRWQIVRWGIRYRLRSESANSVVLLVLDLVTAIAVIALFAFASVFFINQYNHLAEWFGYAQVVHIRRYLDAIHLDFWTNGIWLLFMVGTMLVPTLCNLAIYLSAGSIESVPSAFRIRLAKELSSYSSLSELNKDWLVWRLAIVDSFAGLIFFVGILTCVAYTAVLTAPAFGELLYVVSNSALRW